MAGNVWEWCRDWYASYSREDAANPLGPAVGDEIPETLGRVRVLRGGSFSNSENDLRAAYRNGFIPDSRYDFIGFRVVSSRLRP